MTSKTTKLDLDTLMERIRVRVAQGTQPGPGTAGPPSAVGAAASPGEDQASLELPRFPVDHGSLPLKDAYRLREILDLQDERFVQSAYVAILGRAADPTGLEHYLGSLRSGALSKAEIVGRLRYSREGRARGVVVSGLRTAVVVRSLLRMPLLRWVIGPLYYVLRLPRIVSNIEQSHAAFNYERKLMVERANAALDVAERALKQVAATAERAHQRSVATLKASQGKATIEQLVAFEEGALRHVERWTIGQENLQREIAAVRLELEQMGPALEQMGPAVTALEADLGRVRPDIAAVVADVSRIRDEASLASASFDERLRAVDTGFARAAQETAAVSSTLHEKVGSTNDSVVILQRDLLDQHRRLAMLLEEVGKRMSEPLQRDSLEVLANEERHLLDQFYASFEDRFRGTREDIKERLAVYIPMIREANAGGADAPVLDIGSGRGEWLELLRDSGLLGSGVDLNRVMVSECTGRGFQAIVGDALEHLRNMPAGSLGAVTGFHIIEHVGFKALIALFDETMRVLRPGGLMIFETPNPENLIVGACNFYFDPTHRQPLPPESTAFLAQARGFDVRILRLHPMHLPAEIIEGAGAKLIETYFTSPQDYALLGIKR